jgi:hypothetical protein
MITQPSSYQDYLAYFQGLSADVFFQDFLERIRVATHQIRADLMELQQMIEVGATPDTVFYESEVPKRFRQMIRITYAIEDILHHRPHTPREICEAVLYISYGLKSPMLTLIGHAEVTNWQLQVNPAPGLDIATMQAQLTAINEQGRHLSAMDMAAVQHAKQTLCNPPTEPTR